MVKLARFGVSMPQSLLARFDRYLAEKNYTNRSEAVRDLVRTALVEQEWEDENSWVAGTLTIIYNHHVRDLNRELTAMQHEEHGLVVSTLHVHLDSENCLEVIVLQGEAGRVRRMADRVISARGVKHGKLTLTTTGKELA